MAEVCVFYRYKKSKVESVVGSMVVIDVHRVAKSFFFYHLVFFWFCVSSFLFQLMSLTEETRSTTAVSIVFLRMIYCLSI